ncbi:MAG: hypothetical protein WCK57_10895 [Verrucomicrobiae bacterium]
MKILARVFALILAFVAGIVAGVSVCYLHLQRAMEAEKIVEAESRANEARYVCGEHHAALYQRADFYRQKFGRWPTNVQELVVTHFLPEYSQVHLCYLQIPASGLITSYDQRGAFIEQTQHCTLGYYVLSPYRFGFDGTNFTVSCTLDVSHNK